MTREAPDRHVSTSRRRLNEARETDILFSPRGVDLSAETSPWEGDGKEAGICETKGSGGQVELGTYSSRDWDQGSSRSEIDQEHVASPPLERCASAGARPFVGRSPQHGGGMNVSAQSKVEMDTVTGLLIDRNDNRELANGRHTATGISHGADCDTDCLSANGVGGNEGRLQLLVAKLDGRVAQMRSSSEQ